METRGQCKHYGYCLANILKGFIRGGVIGVFAKGFLAVISLAL